MTAAGAGVRAAACAAALASAACGARLMKLPSGPGAPAPDAAAVLAESTAACRTITSIVTEAGVSGRIAGRRLRARLLAGLEAPDRARLEAFAFGQQLFVFAARDGVATLLLTRDGRVVEREDARRVLEAVTGVPLDAASLRITLTGCTVLSGTEAAGGRQYGEHARVVSDGSTDWHLQRESAGEPWRLVAAVHRETAEPEWRAEYRDFEGGLPQSIRLVSTAPDRFDLRLALVDPEINPPIDAAAFEVTIPPGVAAMTLDELRAAGPLAAPQPDDDR